MSAIGDTLPIGTMGVSEEDMANERKRLNLYLPKEDGEIILKAARHAAVDAGINLNAWWFTMAREKLSLPEPTKKRPRKK